MVGITLRVDADTTYAGKPAFAKSKPRLGLLLPSLNRVQLSRVFNTEVGESVITSSKVAPQLMRERKFPVAMFWYRLLRFSTRSLCRMLKKNLCQSATLKSRRPSSPLNVSRRVCGE